MNIFGGCCAIWWLEMSRIGELPNDEKLLGAVVRDICFGNARQFLGLGCKGS